MALHQLAVRSKRSGHDTAGCQIRGEPKVTVEWSIITGQDELIASRQSAHSPMELHCAS